MKTIEFSNGFLVPTWGRNGWIKAAGVCLTKTEVYPAGVNGDSSPGSDPVPIVELTPLTSKGKQSNAARIRVPVADVPALIAQLQELVDCAPEVVVEMDDGLIQNIYANQPVSFK